MADNNLFVLVHVNFCVVTVFNATCQNFLGKGVFEQTHHGAAKRTCAIGGVVTLFHQTLLEGIRHRKGDAFLSHAAKHFFEHDFGDLFDFLSIELAEDNDLVEAIKELRAEILLEFFIHKGTNPCVLRIFSTFTREFKTKTTATFFNHLRTYVRGHDDQSVFEVDSATF